jgi:hypothetical protein
VDKQVEEESRGRIGERTLVEMMLQRLVEIMLRIIGGDDGEGSVGEGMYSTVQNVKDDTYSMYGTCHRIPLLSTERQRQQYSLQNFTGKSECL